MGTEQSTEGGGMNRRNLIKAGVATGVAAAAWASPAIQSASVVALDASNCTAPIISFTSDKVNANSSAGCANLGYIMYGNNGSASVQLNVPGFGVVFINADNPTTGDRCSISPGPSYNLVPTNSNLDLTCDIGLITVYRQSDESVIATIPSSTSGRLPEILSSSVNSPAFIRLTVECCPTVNWHP